MDQNQTLKFMLAVDLPQEFVRTVMSQAAVVYREAFAAVQQNTTLGEWESQYLLGHQRRAHFEAMLRDAAVLHDLPFSMERSSDLYGHSHGVHHVRIAAGRFAFTACHIQSPGAFPKFSRSREQYSRINEHAAQGDMFPDRSDPGETDLYGIIVHSKRHDAKGELMSLAVGFPDADFKRWIQVPTPLAEIDELQTAMRGVVTSAEEEDVLRPRWKVDQNAIEG